MIPAALLLTFGAGLIVFSVVSAVGNLKRRDADMWKVTILSCALGIVFIDAGAKELVLWLLMRSF